MCTLVGINVMCLRATGIFGLFTKGRLNTNGMKGVSICIVHELTMLQNNETTTSICKLSSLSNATKWNVKVCFPIYTACLSLN